MMRRYFAYLWYVIRHKWFVFLECCKLGIPWAGIVHDLSKLLPSEFIPYAQFFHNSDGSKKQKRSKTGYYKPTDTGDETFDFAWFLHQKRNRHHWQWWVLPLANSSNLLRIPMKYRSEMLADWLGAGRAQGTSDIVAWYQENRFKMRFHPDARGQIEFLLSWYCGA